MTMMKIDSDKYCVHSNGWWWGSTVTIIKKDGSGFVEVFFSNKKPNTAYISGLSVAKAHRKRGIGRELIELCIEIASLKNMRFVEIDVEYDNDWLVRWYERMGFVVLLLEDHTQNMLKALD